MFEQQVSRAHTFHVKHKLSPCEAVSRETRDRLETYLALLTRWNSRINLVGPRTLKVAWRRHFADSLQLLPLIPAEATCGADLGSGAGFPGLVLAIASGLHFHLVESDVRKAAFLREVCAATGALSTIHAARLEVAAVPMVDVVTARAFAPMIRLLPLATQFLQPGGVALLLKGENVDEELTQASAEWHMKVERHDSVTDTRGVILRVSEVRRV